MSILIRNQKPAIFLQNPFDIMPQIDPSDADFEGKTKEHIMEKYIDPIFQPINTNNSVMIEDNSTNPAQRIDKDTISGAIDYLWDNTTQNITLQEQLNEIYRQSLQHHIPNDWYFEEQLGVEALARCSLPLPSEFAGRIVRYSISMDVIPSAKAFLANHGQDEAIAWFANIIGYIHSKPINNYLLLTVRTADVFNDIKQQVKNYMNFQSAQNTMPYNQNTVNLLNDFDKISLDGDLSAGIFLPNEGLTSQEERDVYSFSRIITNAIAVIEKTNDGLSIQPSNLKQLYYPENIIILNLEQYSHATAKDIKKDWKDLEKAIRAKTNLRIISNKKLLTAKTVNRNLGDPNKSDSANSRGKEVFRAKPKPFSGKPIPARAMLKMMKKIIEKSIVKMQTENTYKSHKSSYMRPNRRKPDDINLPGKLQVTKYRPDIHIYLDTSGSISESQYRDAIINLINLTKRINCNLYLTSFSHYVSQTTLLKTKENSTKNIYQQFLKVPKVTGGTDFEQVWNKIDILDNYNKKNNKSYQLNFLITDFGYSLSSMHRWHPQQASVKHTYYVPISTNKQDWKYIVRWAKEFTQQMLKAGDYGIRSRILM